jgi:ABC-type antimicrobial peptide transport system permease subunit
MFLKEGGLTLIAGVALGMFGAMAVARILESQLHGVKQFDGATFLGACAFMGLAGLLAIWRPAKRAAAQNPIGSLKEN